VDRPETEFGPEPVTPVVDNELPDALKSFRLWEIVPACAIALGALVQGVSMDPRHWDLALAYRGGIEAWATGHPEWVRSWMSTPFLGLTMALVSHLATEDQAVEGLLALSIVLVGIALGLVWNGLRGRVPRAFWWATLALTAFFAPLLSCFFYKQFNVIALGVALGGFAAVRRGRWWLGSVLIAASVSLKPIVVLLPLALLARRDTRRAGILTLAAIILLSLLAQAFLASRAGDARVLSPLPSLQNFQEKAERWISSQENFSPRGLLCRLARQTVEPPLTDVFGSVVVLILILLANDALGNRSGTSWEIFAFACLLSPMVGPVAWAHYQLLEVPLLLLLACQFLEARADWKWWALLGGAYALSDLLLRPLDDSVPGALVAIVTGRHESERDLWAVMAIAQFAQYLLYGTALAWFRFSRGQESTEG
jgi:hypothetical protein